MIESSLTERPSPLRAVSHLYLIVDLLHPLVCLGVKTCQHTPWLGQWCCGLSGLTNCLVYVILSAAGIMRPGLTVASLSATQLFSPSQDLWTLLLRCRHEDPMCPVIASLKVGLAGTVPMRHPMSDWAACEECIHTTVSNGNIVIGNRDWRDRWIT